ncbi:diacylglycerol kinase family protein [Massilia terrae]|uniref:Sphingosine kinase n=1 Tax=Massilia terrae TaxID=1811224 RepID=A0ABT2D1W8_9BURK|nr:diacylglycerol kinase family protein [Massilia terrae]MCS0660240.1 sphingosine kinase [Massilia terrae]
MRRAAVIVNGGAGSGHDKARAGAVRDSFGRVGVDASVTLASTGGEILQAARVALEGDHEIIVGGGGDGTMNAVASVLVGTGKLFGVLPLGTLNHFAKDIGMPLDLDQAVHAIATGRHKQVDVGVVNGKVFLNNSSLGLYPDMVHDRDRQRRRLGRGKWLAAAWASVAALRRYPFLSVRMNVDGQRLARRTPFVFIGNNQYRMQGLSIGERARLDAGVLSLYVAQHPSRFGLLRFALRALAGRLAQERDFDVLLASEMEVATSHRRIRVATDGEVMLMESPLRYRVLPGALTVVVPQ